MSKKCELTVTSVFYMTLVIFIHIASEGVTNYRTDSLPFAVLCSAHRLSSFAVQGFLFLSGLKLFLPRKDKKFSYPKFYISRVRRVVLPYLFVFSLFAVYFVVTGRMNLDIPYFLRECVSGGLVGHFYYVAIQCGFYLLIPIWRFVSEKCSMPIACTVSLLTMLICRVHLPEIVSLLTGYEIKNNGRLVTTFLFWFVCGMFCGKNYDVFVDFLEKRRVEITVLTAVSGVIDCVLIWVIRNGIYYPVWADDFHVLYCFSAVLCTISYARKFVMKHPSAANHYALGLVDKASYNVYLIHPLFIFVTDSILNKIGIQSITARLVIRAVTVYAVSVGICTAWEIIKERITKKVRKNS